MHTDRSISNFRRLVQIPTVVSLNEADTDWAPFELFIDTLAQLYPLIHATLERELVDSHSVLFRWAGSSTAQPSVLMAHYDVVPATEDGWAYPPFAATVTLSDDDPTVWGRGTLDDKAALTCILEAVEARLADDFVPANDIYLSFGHNEETSGTGAQAIADLLESRGVHPALVLDEGGAVVKDVFPGVIAPVAVVGVSEKGILNVRLTAIQEGGHSSTPPRVTAPVRLARAILRLNARPFPAKLSAVNVSMIRTLGLHASGAYRPIFRGIAITRPFVARALARLSDETNALTRTTAAVTMLSASAAVNALAARAEASVNIRIAVGSTVEQTLAHLRRSVRDPAVVITVDAAHEPSPVSSTSGSAWRLIGEVTRRIFPEAILTPYVMLGATDSRHFARTSPYVYRFSPFEMSLAERRSLHAVDERIRVSVFLRGVRFYETLIAEL